MPPRARTVHQALVRFALEFPEAWQDQPWPEDNVAKVGKKIFVFFGSGDPPGLSVKLPDSKDQALVLGCASPTGYGLWKSGWVTIDLTVADCPPRPVIEDWIEESYRTVAPKTLVKRLDAERSA